MDFFEQLKRTDLPAVQIPGIQRTRSFTDRVLNQYLRLFAHRLKPIKPLAMINGDMPVYDLTQPPLYSQAGARLLRTGFEHQVLKREPRPITMVIMLTKACDMHCRHCSAREYMRPGVESMDYEEICDLLDQFIELGGTSVVISGGEPTLHPRLMDVVARVPIDKAVVAMFTNGSRLDATMAAELRSAGLYAALVSLDSSVPEEHDDRRQRKGAYAQALRAVDAVLESGMLGGISTYMSRPDLERGGFDAMMRVAEDTGVHQIFIFDTVPTGALLKERELLLTPAHRAQLRDLVKEYNATPSGPAIMGQSWVNSSEGVGCFAGFYQMYVTAAGDLTPCDFTPITFGNVRKERLETIWRRMRASEDWGVRHPECRMQDTCFRRTTVDLLPDGADLPVPYARILELRKAAGISSSVSMESSHTSSPTRRRSTPRCPTRARSGSVSSAPTCER